MTLKCPAVPDTISPLYTLKSSLFQERCFCDEETYADRPADLLPGPVPGGPRPGGPDGGLRGRGRPGGHRPGHPHRGRGRSPEPLRPGHPGRICHHGRQGQPERRADRPGGHLPLPRCAPGPLGLRLCGGGGESGAGVRLFRRHLPPRSAHGLGRGGLPGAGPAGLRPGGLLRGLPHRAAGSGPQPGAGSGGERPERRRRPHPPGRHVPVL